MEQTRPHWEKAVRACMACLADQATPQEARRLFRLAAKEAGALGRMSTETAREMRQTVVAMSQVLYLTSTFRNAD
ncbi:DUF982 domain-containing protein [Mesorhizobium sp. CO1-1-11]|uniref:DUF982 domain-containing protein n=1 Tax=Mesorhizobium sp. CO1-1-11 TaxID=2876636 RepID=UPI001CCA0511|nr:DUF982 domain-containing protein [Mesorhizobium sp. CO1-1-11]MBZ9725800.1 DUF982 domain-containing protein [Mesorhizobium sp. CO1-1-11]